MNRKNRNLVHNVKNLDEFLDLTDSEESSSSSDMQVFERNEAFVLELHELQRDELPDNPLPEPSPPAQAPPAPQPAEVKLPTSVPPPPPALEAARDPSTTITKPVTPPPK
ncbi:hypothetical protein MSG28_004783 [Choristoneura fumiferana]|uniref:Uncharacterized protein n=1 Tax=Choristoneura fumiferana TaxID=7141 RepID=A0ACC0K8M7_CHOFU|nr:hypothetical protein MSG28_004783 [Choristoneura fumiferana]